MFFKRIGKIFLFVLLGIIALPIVLLLLVFFLILCLGKIRYRVNAKVGDKNAADVEVSYFRWLVRYAVKYADGETDVKGRIAWIKIGEEKPEAIQPEPESELEPEPAPIPHKIETSPSLTMKKEIEQPQEEHEKKEKAPEKPKEMKNEKKKKEKKDPLGFIKQIREFTSEHEIKKIIGLTFRCIGKFLKALKPKHIDISGVIGFDDPATTGWAMGSYEAIVGVTGLKPHIRILGSYFEKALRLDIDTHGRTRLGSIIWPFLWLALQKPVRKLIRKQIFS